MRVWDIHPGFLNRQSLLGEHREIHAIHTILTLGKKGYSRHPETLRWRDHLGALWLRHEQVVVEMRVRGFNHFSPLLPPSGTEIIWPSVFIDAPSRQFELLAEKYAQKEQGRFPLPIPTGVDELLASHAHALTSSERRIFKTHSDTPDTFAAIASALVQLLRQSAAQKARAVLGASPF
ncbi:MAG: hypothetical protein FP813_00225 [Desulfurivibrio sp.]|nr:hypothetical protein [Desulfurivibrio sp.]MBU4034085.1 pyrimidine dimer DNA glycosylase/endonuclease V [Pseudomonadota bacterium]MBU4117677.1 pyrimidine dimer DNA glycosylase/endonuclease V [Pseudomonadota bacterium]